MTDEIVKTELALADFELLLSVNMPKGEQDILTHQKCSLFTLSVSTRRKQRHFWGAQEPEHALCFSAGFLTKQSRKLREENWKELIKKFKDAAKIQRAIGCS